MRDSTWQMLTLKLPVSDLLLCWQTRLMTNYSLLPLASGPNWEGWAQTGLQPVYNCHLGACNYSCGPTGL